MAIHIGPLSHAVHLLDTSIILSFFRDCCDSWSAERAGLVFEKTNRELRTWSPARCIPDRSALDGNYRIVELVDVTSLLV